MPHFTLPLDVGGPILNAAVFVSSARRAVLLQMGHPVPQAILIRALVDTGASFTAIEPSVLQKLSLTPTGTIEIATPSTGQGTHTTDTFDIDFAIGAGPNDSPFVMPNLRVAAAELFSRQGIHALIGREILQRHVFIYNGSMNQFSVLLSCLAGSAELCAFQHYSAAFRMMTNPSFKRVAELGVVCPTLRFVNW